ncbi:MAG: hypothetical protein QXU46_07005 [Candidatus Bathyarchaeia archaeon]
MGKKWFQHYKRLANLEGQLTMIKHVRKHVEETISQKIHSKEAIEALNEVISLCKQKETECNERIKNEIRRYSQSRSRDPELDRLFKEIFGEDR